MPIFSTIFRPRIAETFITNVSDGVGKTGGAPGGARRRPELAHSGRNDVAVVALQVVLQIGRVAAVGQLAQAQPAEDAPPVRRVRVA